MVRFLYRILQEIGIDLRKPIRGAVGLVWYCTDLFKYVCTGCKEFPIKNLDPCIADRFASSGQTQSVYFLQDLHVAQLIFARNPKTHIDVGSRVDGFVSNVASFRPIEVYDIRPNTSVFENIRFVQADLTDDLPDSLFGVTDSLSSLHAIEHFGLGRYGDPLLANGWKVGLTRMIKLLCQGGAFYLSVPVGVQRCEFNSQRVFSLKFIVNELEHLGLELRNVWLITDSINIKSVDIGAILEYEGVEACAIFDMYKV